MTDYKTLEITRTINVPQQAVWDAWTQPEKFNQWFMPSPFKVASSEFDLHPGGQLKVETQSPDGLVMLMTGEFKAVDKPNKLVMTNSPLDENGNKLFEVQHTVELSEAGGQTKMKVISEVMSAGPNADRPLAGMEQGLNQALDQLSSILISS
jgi:uncharacterized protein YndB with AHSA1/START domain